MSFANIALFLATRSSRLISYGVNAPALLIIIIIIIISSSSSSSIIALF